MIFSIYFSHKKGVKIMILVCNNFTYTNTLLSDRKLMSVNFNDDTSLPSAIHLEMDESELLKNRPEKTGFGMKYSDALEFEIHLMKDDTIVDYSDLPFSENEYEDVVAWLTSPRQYNVLKIVKENNKEVICRGYFSSVEPYDVSGICYGLICTFKCNSPFSYVEKNLTKSLSNYQTLILNNESSERNDYVYPILNLHPTINEEIFIHNLSDSTLIISGALPETTSLALAKKIDEYGLLHGYEVTYIYDGQFVQTHCNETVILFYYTDSYGIRNKYVAYYTSNSNYYIYQGGFFYCNLYKDLDVIIDCKNLGLYDTLNRPVLLTKMGIQDEDEIYWPRLLYGNNSILIKGNVNISIQWFEPQKGALI